MINQTEQSNVQLYRFIDNIDKLNVDSIWYRDTWSALQCENISDRNHKLDWNAWFKFKIKHSDLYNIQDVVLLGNIF